MEINNLTIILSELGEEFALGIEFIQIYSKD